MVNASRCKRATIVVSTGVEYTARGPDPVPSFRYVGTPACGHGGGPVSVVEAWRRSIVDPVNAAKTDVVACATHLLERPNLQLASQGRTKRTSHRYHVTVVHRPFRGVARQIEDPSGRGSRVAAGNGKRGRVAAGAWAGHHAEHRFPT